MAEINSNYIGYSGGNPFGSQAKLLCHWDRLCDYLRTGDTTPILMEINPTNVCNLRCKWCINENSRGSEKIEINALERFFTDFKEIGGEAITFSGGGEPTSYEYFERAVISAKNEGLDLGLMTNGVYPKKYNDLIGKNFQWVRFSLDTLDKKHYKTWKGVEAVDKVVSNIIFLSDYPIKRGVNCNVGEALTIREVKDLVSLFIDKSCANYLQFRPVLPRYFMGEIPKINQKVWGYLDSIRKKKNINLSDDKFNDMTKENSFPFKSCEGHFFEPILDATGEVKICMYHPRDSRFSFGNIHEKSFKDIWSSVQRQEAIKFVRKLDYASECQLCCKLTEPNKLIDFLTHPEEVPDRHFL